jgi:hypothetical protein
MHRRANGPTRIPPANPLPVQAGALTDTGLAAVTGHTINPARYRRAWQPHLLQRLSAQADGNRLQARHHGRVRPHPWEIRR